MLMPVVREVVGVEGEPPRSAELGFGGSTSMGLLPWGLGPGFQEALCIRRDPMEDIWLRP